MGGMKGSKRQRSPGVWELRVYVGRVDGQDRQKSRTFRGSASAADKALRDLIAEVEAGQHTPRHDPGSVADVLVRWLEERSPDWSPRTEAENRAFVDRYLTGADAPGQQLARMDAARVKPRDVTAFYRTLAEQVGVPTARRAHSHLGAAFGDAVRAEELARNPARLARPPKALPREDRDVTVADVVAVMRAAVDSGDMLMATIIRFALATGARRGEIAAVRWRDIDLEAGTVRIHRAVVKVGDVAVVKGTKTGAQAVVALDAGTVEMLRRWHAELRDAHRQLGERVAPAWFVWGGMDPVDPDRITGRWRVHCRAAGVRMRFHDIRHASGSFLLSAGVGPGEVAQRQRHSPKTLLDRYTHGDDAAERAAADKLGAEIERALGVRDGGNA